MLGRISLIMELHKDMPDCFESSLNKLIYFSQILIDNRSDEIFNEVDIPSAINRIGQDIEK